MSTTPSTTASADPLLRLSAALVFLAAAASYASLAAAGFVWDDVPLVLNNSITGSLSNLPEFFTQDLWQGSAVEGHRSGYYRPLFLLSLAVDQALWGDSAAGHHLHSVAWHLMASSALLMLLRRLVTPWAALVGASIFLLHPVQSEAVAWVAARNDPMLAAFVFSSMAALSSAMPGRARLTAGALLALCAMLSKESAVMLAPLLLVLDLARFGRPRGVLRYLAVGAGLALGLGLRLFAEIGSASTPDGEQLAMLVRSGPAIVGHYAMRVVWPSPLSVGHTIEYLNPSAGVLAAGLLAALGLVAAPLVRGRRLAAAGLVFAALMLAPALLAIAVRGQLGERYLYLPMGGLALAIAAGLPNRRAAMLPLLGLAPLWLLVLHHRLPEWQNDRSLWVAAVEDLPSGYTWASLAHTLNDGGAQTGLAVALFQKALEDQPPYTLVCEVAIRSPLKRNMLPEALKSVRLSQQANCPPTNTQVELQALTLAHHGLWSELPALIDELEDASTAPGPLIRAALATQRSDLPALAAARADQLAAGTSADAFDAQVSQLLGVAQLLSAQRQSDGGAPQ